MAELIIAVISIILTLIAIFYAKQASRHSKNSLDLQRKQDVNNQRRDVREQQPRLKIWARSIGGGGKINIKANVINHGKAPAQNVTFRFKGSNAVKTVEKIGHSKTPNGRMYPQEVDIEIPHDDPLFNDEIDKPEMTVTYHDKWHAEIEYPIIHVPFNRRSRSDTAAYKYFPDFPAGNFQNPEWQYAFHDYSDEQILEIWQKEFS